MGDKLEYLIGFCRPFVGFIVFFHTVLDLVTFTQRPRYVHSRLSSFGSVVMKAIYFFLEECIVLLYPLSCFCHHLATYVQKLSREMTDDGLM
jgi:hypothetical protein